MFPMYSYLVLCTVFAQELEWEGYLLGYRGLLEDETEEQRAVNIEYRQFWQKFCWGKAGQAFLQEHCLPDWYSVGSSPGVFPARNAEQAAQVAEYYRIVQLWVAFWQGESGQAFVQEYNLPDATPDLDWIRFLAIG